jgi:hypothetical protein
MERWCVMRDFYTLRDVGRVRFKMYWFSKKYLKRVLGSEKLPELVKGKKWVHTRCLGPWSLGLVTDPKPKVLGVCSYGPMNGADTLCLRNLGLSSYLYPFLLGPGSCMDPFLMDPGRLPGPELFLYHDFCVFMGFRVC